MRRQVESMNEVAERREYRVSLLEKFEILFQYQKPGDDLNCFIGHVKNVLFTFTVATQLKSQ